jgi:hypothetical protein
MMGRKKRDRCSLGVRDWPMLREVRRNLTTRKSNRLKQGALKRPGERKNVERNDGHSTISDVPIKSRQIASWPRRLLPMKFKHWELEPVPISKAGDSQLRVCKMDQPTSSIPTGAQLHRFSPLPGVGRQLLTHSRKVREIFRMIPQSLR